MNSSVFETYKRLFKYLFRYRLQMALVIVLAISACVASAFAPLFSGKAVDALSEIFDRGYNEDLFKAFLFFIIGMFVLYVVKGLFDYICGCLMVSASQKAIHTLRKQMYDKIDSLPLSFFDKASYGDILSRLTNDIDAVTSAFSSVIVTIVQSTILLVAIFALMLSISFWLTLVSVLSLELIIVLTKKLSKTSTRAFDESMEKTGELNGYVEEYYTGQTVVNLLNNKRQVVEDFNETNESLFENSYKARFLSNVIARISLVSYDVCYILICVIGVISILQGSLSVGMILAFMQYLGLFCIPVRSMASLVGVIQQSNASAKRIFEFLDAEEEAPDSLVLKSLQNAKGEVRFEHVYFGYEEGNPIIKDLNLTIEAGSSVAIVGPTGAGKTTIMNLLLRFYEVDSGAIYIDGINIADMRKSDLRTQFGIVTQDSCWLYSDSILENIRYGSFGKSDEEVVEAAKQVRVHDFIQRLPGGYRFVLSEGGSNIAQGQRQLISIARAVLSDPNIVILDEATSNVDTLTERRIQKALAKVMEDKTSFVIAHRLSTIYGADMILYMDQGEVLESGTHEELIEKDGLYAQLYRSQFAEKE